MADAVEPEDVDDEDLNSFKGIIPEENDEDGGRLREEDGTFRINVDEALDRSEEDLECPEDFSDECEGPCECCDGPEPRDCVICSRGYDCHDDDNDGAGECVKAAGGDRVCMSALAATEFDEAWAEEDDELDGDDNLPPIDEEFTIDDPDEDSASSAGEL
eukprot:CAMPEP_0178430492 /NCGR_PEP_ID=MMETSP0689_2-20121128/31347_1 /TAXON_ID=160604 /ORGANISM="Amphidinium massartii, Strain CS-259" /LENGTH=159 /DNA_ID=CAMNT_0020052349 /DNA_START=157 /DNA_END=636 /DNA_ORIENTATION=+